MLVVGDLIADEFIYGEVARVSREAPVLILKYDATEMVAGGAGNAANNVAALGGARAPRRAWSAPMPKGRRLLASFHRGVDRAHVVRAREYRTPVKTRILAGGVHAARAAGRAHRSRSRLAARRGGQPRRCAKKIEPALDGCDAVLLSDYGSGLVTPALADADSPRASRAGRAGARSRCCSTRATGCSTTAG